MKEWIKWIKGYKKTAIIWHDKHTLKLIAEIERLEKENKYFYEINAKIHEDNDDIRESNKQLQKRITELQHETH